VEPLSEALRRLRRQSELEDAIRRPGGIRVVEERENCGLREQLKRYPAAVRAILDDARRLHRPVETLSPRDVEAGQRFGDQNHGGAWTSTVASNPHVSIFGNGTANPSISASLRFHLLSESAEQSCRVVPNIDSADGSPFSVSATAREKRGRSTPPLLQTEGTPR